MVRGVDAKKGAGPHKLLVAALTKQLGTRVVSLVNILQAQVDSGVTADDLATPTGVSRLATASKAERVVVVSIEDLMTRIEVYATLDGAPPLVLELPRKKKDPLDSKWAAAVAAAIATRAEDALAPRVEAPVMDLSESEPPPPPPPPPPPKAPLLTVALGGGVALRAVDVSGPLATKVSAMDSGVVPSVSGYVGFAPLRLVDETAWWNDMAIELMARRGIADARTDDVVCTVDDDDVTLGVSWRARISDEPFIPRVGGGISAGIERFLIGGCSIPALSTQATQAAGFLRLAQPLLPGMAEADLLVGARVPVVGGKDGFERPGYVAQLAVTATPTQFLFLRAAARVTESRLTVGPAPDLVVGDTRAIFELQVGGQL